MPYTSVPPRTGSPSSVGAFPSSGADDSDSSVGSVDAAPSSESDSVVAGSSLDDAVVVGSSVPDATDPGAAAVVSDASSSSPHAAAATTKAHSTAATCIRFGLDRRAKEARAPRELDARASKEIVDHGYHPRCQIEHR